MADMKEFPTYKLTDDAQNALAALVNSAMTKLVEPIEGSSKLVADIYTGRDPLGGGYRMIIGDQGMPFQKFNDALSLSLIHISEPTRPY